MKFLIGIFYIFSLSAQALDFGTLLNSINQESTTTCQEPILSSGDLIDLSNVDFNQHPELAGYVDQLNASFQILKFNPEEGRASSPSRGAATLPIGHENNPYARELVSICSGSFLPNNRVATATHCLRSKGEDFSTLLILRQHQYEIKEGRLHYKGFQDFRVKNQSTPIIRNGDTSILELEDGKNSERIFSLTGSNRPLPPNQKFSILGYPSHSYARPHLSLQCSVASPGEVSLGMDPGVRSNRCHVEGGMSGGPVFVDEIGFPQVSTVSSSGGTDEHGHFASGALIAE